MYRLFVSKINYVKQQWDKHGCPERVRRQSPVNARPAVLCAPGTAKCNVLGFGQGKIKQNQIFSRKLLNNHVTKPV